VGIVVAVHHVGAVAVVPDQGVAAWPTVHNIIAPETDQPIIAAVAAERVGQSAPQNRIAPVSTTQCDGKQRREVSAVYSVQVNCVVAWTTGDADRGNGIAGGRAAAGVGAVDLYKAGVTGNGDWIG